MTQEVIKPKSGREGVCIDINHSWCKSCGICIAFCPKKVYESDAYGQPVITDSDKCTKCMLCVERCPEMAIEVSGERKKKDESESEAE